jgi:hypothetical protein
MQTLRDSAPCWAQHFRISSNKGTPQLIQGSIASFGLSAFAMINNKDHANVYLNWHSSQSIGAPLLGHR